MNGGDDGGGEEWIMMEEIVVEGLEGGRIEDDWRIVVGDDERRRRGRRFVVEVDNVMEEDVVAGRGVWRKEGCETEEGVWSGKSGSEGVMRLRNREIKDDFVVFWMGCVEIGKGSEIAGWGEGEWRRILEEGGGMGKICGGVGILFGAGRKRGHTRDFVGVKICYDGVDG
ncbi:hypothetical protein Tco_0435619 [Tanacetum coccineum]